MMTIEELKETADRTKEVSSALSIFLVKLMLKVNQASTIQHEYLRPSLIILRDSIKLRQNQLLNSHDEFDETLNAIIQILSIIISNNFYQIESELPKILETLFVKIANLISQKSFLIEYRAEIYIIFEIFKLFFKEQQSGIRELLEGQLETGVDKKTVLTLCHETMEEMDFNHQEALQKYSYFFINTWPLKKIRELEFSKVASTTKHILLPFLMKSLQHLSPEKCLNCSFEILIHFDEIHHIEKLISIFLQETGGFYIKLAQILADSAPLKLANELKHLQNKTGGLFKSQKKSAEYIKELFINTKLKEHAHYFHTINEVISPFAGASIGSIYELQIKKEYQHLFHSKQTVLLKIKRPGIEEELKNQKVHFFLILDSIKNDIKLKQLNTDLKSEIFYHLQSIYSSAENMSEHLIHELDFRLEKSNAALIQNSIRDLDFIKIPFYYFAERDYLIMEKCEGIKISAGQKLPLKRRMQITNNVMFTYIHLMFKKGIIWSDPHPGNLLLTKDLTVVLLDLNPCYVWEENIKNEFISLIFNILIKCTKQTLKHTASFTQNYKNVASIEFEKNLDIFFKESSSKNIPKLILDFLKFVSKNGILLNNDIQIAIKGMAQIFITTSTISYRNNFTKIIRSQFDFMFFLKHIIKNGPLNTLSSLLPFFIASAKKLSQIEIGPPIDERDIYYLKEQLQILKTYTVCHIELKRKSPEDFPLLELTSDNQTLLNTSFLMIHSALNDSLHARYSIILPTHEWLKQNQNTINYFYFAEQLCTIETLESYKENRGEDFEDICHSWNIDQNFRTIDQNFKISQIKYATKKTLKKRIRRVLKLGLSDIGFTQKSLLFFILYFEKEIINKEIRYYSTHLQKFNLHLFYKTQILAFHLIIIFLKTFFNKKIHRLNLIQLSSDILLEETMPGLIRRNRI